MVSRSKLIVSRWLRKSQQNWLLESLLESDLIGQRIATFLSTFSPKQLADKFGENLEPIFERVQSGDVAKESIIVFIDSDNNLDLFGKIIDIRFEDEESGTHRVDISADCLGKGATQSTEEFSVLADSESDQELYKINTQELLKEILGG